MSKAKRNALIIAVVFIVIGVLIALVATMLIDFDFSELTTGAVEKKTFEITEPFHSIRIEDTEYDVRIVSVSSSDECRVEYGDSETAKHDIGVENGTLTVIRRDPRPWYYRIGIYVSDDVPVTLYMPQREYEDLYIKSVSGDVSVPEGFSFSAAELLSTSGDVSFCGDVTEALTLKTVSGNVYAKGLTESALTATTTSGKITLSDMTLEGLTASAVSGEIELTEVTVKGSAELEAVSGDIDFDGFDAERIKIETVSGDVEGSLLSAKNFVTDTTSGIVRVPLSDPSLGRCEIETTSGDIEIWIANSII